MDTLVPSLPEQWVAALERLPPAGQRVLCVLGRKRNRPPSQKILYLYHPVPGSLKKQAYWRGEVVNGYVQTFDLNEVTDWQPIPALPQRTHQRRYK